MVDAMDIPTDARARRFYEARGFVASEFTDGLRNEESQPDVLYTWRPCASSLVEVSGAQAQATDVASHKTATASI
jgi:hypothetical protein